jgi:hypothetical protein
LITPATLASTVPGGGVTLELVIVGTLTDSLGVLDSLTPQLQAVAIRIALRIPATKNDIDPFFIFDSPFSSF